VGDDASLESHVLKILDNPSFGNKLKAGAKTKLESFTAEKTAMQTEQVYREVISSME
jgi:glycosyltransferase involved in cell wall biosynthesis